jgi:hypothetical protein
MRQIVAITHENDNTVTNPYFWSHSMSIEFTPSRDPLRRLGSVSLVTGFTGLAAVIYVMVKMVRGNTDGTEWLLGTGFCLLFLAVVTSLVHGVLLNYKSRIETLEKRADGTR